MHLGHSGRSRIWRFTTDRGTVPTQCGTQARGMFKHLTLAVLSISPLVFAGEVTKRIDVPVAVVAGTAITEEELDASAGSEIYALKAQLHEARKRALTS